MLFLLSTIVDCCNSIFCLKPEVQIGNRNCQNLLGPQHIILLPCRSNKQKIKWFCSALSLFWWPMVWPGSRNVLPQSTYSGAVTNAKLLPSREHFVEHLSHNNNNELKWMAIWMLWVSCTLLLCIFVGLSYWIEHSHLTSLFHDIDPLHIVGMQPIWGQNKWNFLFWELRSYCSAPPDWLHSHRRARGLYHPQHTFTFWSV